MTDDEFQDELKALMLRVKTAEARTAEYCERKALAEAEQAEHTRDYVRDYYRLPSSGQTGGVS